ncbi:hypothetical protein D3OALGA1CA_5856 [Olavius algarvensis associated proteobacterium Delta 3]|nr:hypothetical protein D3OALGB2SA_1288 [Olavius algarvensis associated proteobacterium Delta 3]CAB5172696.1 hypothetical protein D3OALGA1CA_5856 [Olavius algarvensis associated proteobacterium Delta 3]
MPDGTEVAHVLFGQSDPNQTGKRIIMDDSAHLYPVKNIPDIHTWEALALFKKRAEEFIHIQDSIAPESNRHRWATFEQQMCTEDSHIPSDETLKFFYDAFRFCYAKQEASNFQNITGIISKVTIGEHERAYLESLKFQWNVAETRIFTDSLVDRDISGKEIMDLWFEEECDHCDREEKERLYISRNLQCDEASRVFLFQTVLAAGEPLRLLYDVIEPLASENLVVSVPDFFISCA